MVVSARAKGLCILTLVALKDRGVAQQTVPVHINLSRRLIFRRSKEDVTPTANETTALLQRPRLMRTTVDAHHG
jgi:hypothetical protein